MSDFEERECSVIRSEWIPSDYQYKQGVKGGRTFSIWSNGSKHVRKNGTEKIFTPTQHKLVCKDKDGNIFTTNVTQAAHRNGEQRWNQKKAENFLINIFFNGLKLLCSQNSKNAYITDESFNENSKIQQSPEFGISDLFSKNKILGSDWTEFK